MKQTDREIILHSFADPNATIDNSQLDTLRRGELFFWFDGEGNLTDVVLRTEGIGGDRFYSTVRREID